MSLILHIETSTTMCSVSISDKTQLLASKEMNDGYSHAENLHLFIESVLKEASIKITTLNAIAVSKGPGSYTGLRIGVSAAKGLAYALNIPLISVDTLQIMAFQAKQLSTEATYLCPMLDARRMEVYSRVYTRNLEPKNETQAIIIDEETAQQFKDYKKIVFFGDGMLKCKPMLSVLPNAIFLEGVIPSSQFMLDLAYKKFLDSVFEDVAYFEPFYLKDFLILKKKTNE